MSYTAWEYYAMVLVLLPVYYLLPKKLRWTALLGGSLFFYVLLLDRRLQLVLMLGTVAVDYLAGLWLERLRRAGRSGPMRAVLAAGVLVTALPLLTIKLGSFAPGALAAGRWSLIVPVGLSYYTLQMIAYLADVARGKTAAQRNPLKFCLFATFFPQVIQGPIPRYDRLEKSLFGGNDYSFENIVAGAQLVLWGFFLKYMIADKAAIFVNAVFGNHRAYGGGYVVAAGLLYTVQLYADFLACSTLAQGVAQMFGVELEDNFRRPLFSASMREYWKRWHITLSTWLRDYVYIPLGGSRGGSARRWLNIMLTFLLSGLWHGGGAKILAWGFLHAVWQIGEDIAYSRGRREAPGGLRRLGAQARSFAYFTFTNIVFRAGDLRSAWEMIRSLFTVFNPWIWFDDSLFLLGLGWKEFAVLLLSIAVLFFVDVQQEKGVRIRTWIAGQKLPVRWGIYLAAVWAIWVFGTYGYGFDAGDFIYGGF